MAPDAPEPGTPDPGLFAPLTLDENRVLCMHLISGWYKQGAVWPALSGTWRETCDIIDDLGQAWDIAFDARPDRQSCGADGGAL